MTSTDMDAIKEVIREELSKKDVFFLDTSGETVNELIQIFGETMPFYVSDEEAKKHGFEGAVIPPSIIPTLVSSKLGEIFARLAPKVFKLGGKGIIHVGSHVHFLKPLIAGRKYRLEVSLKDIAEKTGKKGVYLLTSLDIRVYSEDGDLVYRDVYSFFLKVR